MTETAADQESGVRRCRWCRRALPERSGPGRPREFCSQRCRQWDWVARQRAAELELSENELVVARDELDRLHDELYVLARVLVFADVGVLVDQLRDETQREKHADGAKTEAGYATRRGYSLRFDPTEFAFLAAHVCASPVVFEHYARALRAAAEEEEKGGGSDGPLASAAADVERFDVGLIPAS